MNLFSVFQHSVYLELAIIGLEQNGIRKENIFAVPLDKRGDQWRDVQTSHQDARSKVDLVFILGAVFMLLGAIYGFRLHLGPVLWALFGLLFGAGVGFGVELLVAKNLKFQEQETKTDVILIVHCRPNQAEMVEGILWSHNALGVAKTKTKRENAL